MSYISIDNSLVVATVWQAKYTVNSTLELPLSSNEGINGFKVNHKPKALVKKTIKLNKPLVIGEWKSDSIDSDLTEIDLQNSVGPLVLDPIYQGLEDKGVIDNINKYMNRIIGALRTIENVTINASSSPEGSDTSIFSEEEKEARRRLSKAADRLKNIFNDLFEVKDNDFKLLFLEKEVPEEVQNFINFQTT